MYIVSEILLAAGVKYQVYAQWTRGDVLLTEANQLVGTYDSLRRFYALEEAYRVGKFTMSSRTTI